MRSTQRRSSRHSAPPGESRIDSLIQQRRKESGITNAASIPVRDTDDAYGNPFLGLPANRLKYRDLSNDELNSNSVDGRVIKPDEVDTPHLKTAAVNNDKLAGTSVSTGKLQDNAATGPKIASNNHGNDPLGNANQANDANRAISGDHVKTLTLEGFHFKDNSIGGRAITLQMGDVGGKLGAHRISGKIPKHNISGVNWDQVDNKPPLATKHYVDSAIEDVKRWANQKFQKKP